MDNAVISISPAQMLLGLIFQAWFIIFPIIIIRKLNYLIELFRAQFDSDSEQG